MRPVCDVTSPVYRILGVLVDDWFRRFYESDKEGPEMVDRLRTNQT